MIARLSLAAVTAFAAIVGPAAAQHPSTASFTLTDTHASLNGSESSDATVALGARVRFAYPQGEAKHNVNIERSGAVCTQLAGAGAGATGRILPSSPEGPGWTIECRFDTPGVYHFASDEYGTVNGVVRVANADGTVPKDDGVRTPPGQDPSTQPERSTVPGTTTPGGGGSAKPGKRVAARWTIAASQRGTAVRAVLTGGSERSRLAVEAFAKRTELRTKGKAKLVRVGRVSKTVAAGARATVSIPLNVRARAALKRRGRLTLTIKVTVAGKTSSKTVTLRRPRPRV